MHMNLRRSLASVVVAMNTLTLGTAGVALADPPPPGHRAPSPARILARAIDEMSERVLTACAAMNGAADEAIERIVRLHRQGRPDAEIRAAGEAAVDRIQNRAGDADVAIDHIHDVALSALQDAGGTQEQIDRLNTAHERAVGHVNDCRDRDVQRVREAVRRAIHG
jgi:hypothetical protein